MFVPSPIHCLLIAHHSISLTTQPGNLLPVPLPNCARELTGQSDNISAPGPFVWAFEPLVLIICARYACLKITIQLFLSMLVHRGLEDEETRVRTHCHGRFVRLRLSAWYDRSRGYSSVHGRTTGRAR